MLYAVCLMGYDEVWKERILPTVRVQPSLVALVSYP